MTYTIPFTPWNELIDWPSDAIFRAQPDDRNKSQMAKDLYEALGIATDAEQLYDERTWKDGEEFWDTHNASNTGYDYLNIHFDKRDKIEFVIHLEHLGLELGEDFNFSPYLTISGLKKLEQIIDHGIDV